MRAIALIAQPLHQLGPSPGGALRAPAYVGGRAGEAEARKRRNDQIERVSWVAAMRARVGQRVDHFEEFYDRAWPAVREDQRECIWLGRAHVQEVDVLIIN